MRGVDPTGFEFDLDPESQLDRDLLLINGLAIVLIDAGYDATEDRFAKAIAGIAYALVGRDRAIAVGERLVGLQGERQTFLDGLS